MKAVSRNHGIVIAAAMVSQSRVCGCWRAMSSAPGPHMALVSEGHRKSSKAHLFKPSDVFTLEFFDKLWGQYRQRVSYVRTYEEVVQKNGATFFNDHIALRTIALQNPHVGIPSISRVFEVLGYRAKECYQFEDKNLSAIYFEHPHPHLPKVFISQLRSWELSSKSREIIKKSLSSFEEPISDGLLADLMAVGRGAKPRAGLLEDTVNVFQKLPWKLPEMSDVKALNEESQYGSWVLVHGFNVNHFTALINSHGVPALSNIEKTIGALQAAGVPMKKQIEGEVGSNLRQSATEAVMEDVAVMDKGKPTRMPWSYAYFELAQRDPFRGPDGKEQRYEGFLSGQATSLFEMTRIVGQPAAKKASEGR